MRNSILALACFSAAFAFAQSGSDEFTRAFNNTSRGFTAPGNYASSIAQPMRNAQIYQQNALILQQRAAVMQSEIARRNAENAYAIEQNRMRTAQLQQARAQNAVHERVTAAGGIEAYLRVQAELLNVKDPTSYPSTSSGRQMIINYTDSLNYDEIADLDRFAVRVTMAVMREECSKTLSKVLMKDYNAEVIHRYRSKDNKVLFDIPLNKGSCYNIG